MLYGVDGRNVSISQVTGVPSVKCTQGGRPRDTMLSLGFRCADEGQAGIVLPHVLANVDALHGAGETANGHREPVFCGEEVASGVLHVANTGVSILEVIEVFLEVLEAGVVCGYLDVGFEVFVGPRARGVQLLFKGQGVREGRHQGEFRGLGLQEVHEHVSIVSSGGNIIQDRKEDADVIDILPYAVGEQSCNSQVLGGKGPLGWRQRRKPCVTTNGEESLALRPDQLNAKGNGKRG